MAATKLIDLTDLGVYDGLIKQHISDTEAKSIHTVLFDSTNKAIKFYKKENATSADTADYTISIPADLDGSATIASVSLGVVTLKAGITETDGIVTNSSGSDITLAKVATTGAAEDISIADAGGLITATNVEDALQEIAQASAGGVGSKTVYITETSGGSSDPYSKRYGIYQGATGSSSSPVIGEKLTDIDIPKDMVVESGSVVDIVFKASDNTLHEGSESGTDVTVAIMGTATPTAANAGKYIKLIIANSSSTALYIAAKDLVDIYTAQQNATQIQLAIDSNNVISATVVAGSIGTTELAAKSVTTAKIDDAAVGATQLSSAVNASLALADSSVQSVTASDPTTGTNGTITVDGTEVAVKGLGSAAYTASTAYEAAGAVTTAIEALDSNTSSATNTADTGLTVLTEVGIVDGLISTKKSHTLGSAADCADTDFLKSADYTIASQSDIENLFPST